VWRRSTGPEDPRIRFELQRHGELSKQDTKGGWADGARLSMTAFSYMPGQASRRDGMPPTCHISAEVGRVFQIIGDPDAPNAMRGAKMLTRTLRPSVGSPVFAAPRKCSESCTLVLVFACRHRGNAQCDSCRLRRTGFASKRHAVGYFGFAHCRLSSFSRGTLTHKRSAFRRVASLNHNLRLSCSRDDFCAEAEGCVSQVIVEREEPALRNLKRALGAEIHGGTDLVLVEDGKLVAARGLPYLLGAFKTQDRQQRYLNFAFAMQAERPFALLGVSAPLPLLTLHAGFAIVTGLELLPSKGPASEDMVLFAYGASDREARVLSVPLAAVEDWLEPTRPSSSELRTNFVYTTGRASLSLHKNRVATPADESGATGRSEHRANLLKQGAPFRGGEQQHRDSPKPPTRQKHFSRDNSGGMSQEWKSEMQMRKSQRETSN
jgi:hypothetical protein